MISLLGLTVKLVKWLVIAIAYLLVGLVKLATIVVVLAFFGGRAAVRRLLDAKDRNDDDDGDEYDLGYPSGLGRSSERLTRDAFDARWQHERDLRVAERQVDGAGDGKPSLGLRPDERAVAASRANGLVHHDSLEPRWNPGDEVATVVLS